MKLKDCHNFNDFRKLAKKKLPSPIFGFQHQNENLFRESFIGTISPVSGALITENNASLGEKNPGANSYMFNFVKQF